MRKQTFQQFEAVVLGAFFVFCLLMGVSILIALPFLLFWNYAVVPAISVANPINFWTAFWLSLFFSFYVTIRARKG